MVRFIEWLKHNVENVLAFIGFGGMFLWGIAFCIYILVTFN